jgi:magnesium-transporting ATPase (P-type)
VHTHAGHAIAAGSSKFYPLVGRKLLILFSQIKSVLFLALLMITVVLALALWMKKPAFFWSSRWASDRAWTAALFALTIGSVVALVFNDTGITMMGTMVMVTIPVATYHFVGKVGKIPSRDAGMAARHSK